MLLTLSEMAAEADVIPPAVATPTPTAVKTREKPKVKGASAKPAMAVAPPTAVVVPPVMPAILAFWWKSLILSAMAWSMMMACQRISARSVKILLKTRRPRCTLSANVVNDLALREATLKLRVFVHCYFFQRAGKEKKSVIFPHWNQ